MINEARLHSLDDQQLCELTWSLAGEVQRRDREVAFKQAAIEKLAHEMALVNRLQFAAKSEAFHGKKTSLIEQTLDTDLAALVAEIETL